METSAPRSNVLPIGQIYNDTKVFLDIMHPGEAVTFQTVPREGSDVEAKRLHGFLDDLWDELVDYNSRGANIYCTVNGTNGKGRSVNSITSIKGFFVSLRDAPVERLDIIPMKPHVIVATGENCWQAHWRCIPKPVTYGSRQRAADFYKRVQLALAAKVGGDQYCTDLPRCCHVPGFFTYRDGSYQVGLQSTENRSDQISQLLDVFPVS